MSRGCRRRSYTSLWPRLLGRTTWKLPLPMIRLVQQQYARLHAWTISALEMGAKQRADVALLREPPGENGGGRISHYLYEIMKQKRVLTAVGRESDHGADEQTDLSSGANNHVVVTDVQEKERRLSGISIFITKETYRLGRDEGGRLTDIKSSNKEAAQYSLSTIMHTATDGTNDVRSNAMGLSGKILLPSTD